MTNPWTVTPSLTGLSGMVGGGGTPPEPPAVNATIQWNTAKTAGSNTNTLQIKLPLINTGTYNFQIFWGDGSNSTVTAWDDACTTHTYANSGVYNTTIIGNGTLKGFTFQAASVSTDRKKIIDVSSWGPIELGNGGTGTARGQHFEACSNMKITATDAPNLTNTTSGFQMFYQCGALDANTDLSAWDVSTLINTKEMFAQVPMTGNSLANWNLGNVTDFNGMFKLSDYGGDISGWDVHKGVNFQDMFNGNVSQNSDLSDWSMSNATSLSGMFLTSSFNNNINTWDVSKVTTFFNMFSSGAFNQPISGWSTACATTFQGMFQNNGNFNQPVNTLNTSKITNMTNMFSGASTFDQPCDFNDISKVTFVGFNGFAKNSGMSPTNYDKTLNKWANSSPVANAILVRFDPTKYTAAGAAAREYLVNTKGWTITDGGLEV